MTSPIDASNAVVTTAPGDPAPGMGAVLAAVAQARQEVAGYAPTNGTRQAIEALATAVETFAQGAAS